MSKIFMKSTPPSEYTEEQLQHDSDWNMFGPTYYQVGQRLTIADRKVSKLAFLMYKLGSPTGDVTFEIRRISDGVIVSAVWGQAEDLPTELAWKEVEFGTPPTINEEVRIGVYFTGGSPGNVVKVRHITSDVKLDENGYYRDGTGYIDMASYDTAYRYTYTMT